MKKSSASLPVVVFGCGGHGRVIVDVLASAGVNVAGFIDDHPPGPVIDDIPVIGNQGRLIDPDFLARYAIVIGVGDTALRRRLSLDVLARGGRLAVAVHPGATISRRISIGVGTVLMAGTVINTGCRIGRFVIINTGATVDHDCVLEDGVHISPGCHLAGGVNCETDVFIGTGAAIIPKVRIGARAIVGAGAVVIKDVPPDVLVAGCPARVKRRFVPAFEIGCQ